MPNVLMVVTNSLRRAWSQYWAKRPLDEPLDLVETLVQSAVVVDTAGLLVDPADECEVWVHPQLPEYGFIIRKAPIESVVVTLRRVLPKQKLLKGKEKAAVSFVAVAFDPEPAGDHAERIGWWRAELEKAYKWLNSSEKDHPERPAYAARQRECERRIRGMRAELAGQPAGAKVESDREKNLRRLAETDVADDFVLTDLGKLDLIPTIRWLLQEVKALRADLDSRKGRPTR